MEHVGVYLYGFVPAGSSLDLRGVDGVDGVGAIEVADLGGVLAVVGAIPVGPFEAALADGPDPSWLIPRALGHERVLGAVLARSPVLPVRFGSLFSSREALADRVAGHLAAMGEYFAKVGDHREWSLRGYLDAESAAQRALEVDPGLASRFARLPCAPGARYFQEKKLREDARSVSRKLAISVASEIRQAIRAKALDARSLPLREADGSGRIMVLHEAALIARGQEIEVLAAAETASGGMLSLEPSGPWPPFHFCPELGDTSS